MPESINRRRLLRATGAGLVAGSAGCLELIGGGNTEVAVGGKQFTEQLLLSWMSTHMLRESDVSVDDRFPVGGNTANHEAIVNAEVDHYWEYTGTGLNYHLGHEDETIRDPQEQYERVAQAYEEEHDITWLDMADFNNTYIVSANAEWQDETGVETLSGLAEYINEGNEVSWAVSEEYLNNPTAFGDLPEFYGFEENVDNVTWEKMAIGTINYEAVAQGEADLGVGFATDPQFQQFDVGVVEDDRNWFVIYYPAPLVRNEVLNDTVREALNKPPSALDTETMQALNAEVAVEERDPNEVAREFLEDEGFI